MHRALGSVPGYDKALAYVRAKVAAFDRLGRIDLPTMRRQATAVWTAANAYGDRDLARRAEDEFNRITDLQADWEQHNDTLQTVRGLLQGVGITLGVVPVALAAAVVALATAAALLFAARDRIAPVLTRLLEEAVRKGEMTAAQAAGVLAEYDPDESQWPQALILVALVGAAVWFLPRPKRGANG